MNIYRRKSDHWLTANDKRFLDVFDQVKKEDWFYVAIQLAIEDEM